jgi:hypothetical protein
MNYMPLLTFLGTVASIVGAIFSFFQAKRSRNAAKEAKHVQKQLVHQRQTSELAQIQASCERAIKSMDRYGIASAPGSLQGVDPANEANDVQAFILVLKKNKAYFRGNAANEIDLFVAEVSQLLDTFAQSSEPGDLRKYGNQILMKLGDCAAVIKTRFESKRDKLN